MRLEATQSLCRSILCGVLCATALGQSAAHPKTPTIFSYDQPAPHTIPLPASIRDFLEHDRFVTELFQGETPSPTALPAERVLCYRVSLGPAHETDYLMQANPPLGGVNVTPFWVFRILAGKPKLVLFTGGLGLEIKSHVSHGVRDIETDSVTMQQLHTEVYRFNGVNYELISQRDSALR